MDAEIASTASSAPRVRRLSSAVQATDGATEIDNDTDVGVFVLTLRANNTGLTFGSAARAGQALILVIRQGVGAPFTWTPAANMKLAGGNQGATATVQNHRDIYTMIFDGTDWNETARAMDVG